MVNKQRQVDERILKLQSEIKQLKKREVQLKKEIKQTRVKRVKKESKLKEKVKERREIEVPKIRIRKQVVINFRSHEAPYFFSIRAITINPEIDERGLKVAVMEVARSIASNRDFDLSNFKAQYLGYETKQISSNEDRFLNDMKVHIELMVKKTVVARFVR